MNFPYPLIADFIVLLLTVLFIAILYFRLHLLSCFLVSILPCIAFTYCTLMIIRSRNLSFFCLWCFLGKFGQVCDRNGQILMCLRYMVDTNVMHQQAVNALLSQSQKYANLEVPQLFKESFIGMDD